MHRDILTEGLELALEWKRHSDELTEGFLKDEKGNLTKAGTITVVVGATIIAIPLAIVAPIGVAGWLTVNKIKHKLDLQNKKGNHTSYTMSDVMKQNKNKIVKIEYPSNLQAYANVYKKSIKIADKTAQYRKVFQGLTENNVSKSNEQLKRMIDEINIESRKLLKELQNVKLDTEDTVTVSSWNDAKPLKDIFEVSDTLVKKYYALAHHDDWAFYDSNGKYKEPDYNILDELDNIDYRDPVHDLQDLYDAPDKIFSHIKFTFK